MSAICLTEPVISPVTALLDTFKLWPAGKNRIKSKEVAVANEVPLSTIWWDHIVLSEAASFILILFVVSVVDIVAIVLVPIIRQ